MPRKKSIQIEVRGQRAPRNIASGKMWTAKLTKVFDYNKRYFFRSCRRAIKTVEKLIDIQETKYNHFLHCSVVNNIYIIVIISILSGDSTKIKKEKKRQYEKTKTTLFIVGSQNVIYKVFKFNRFSF